jgi:signal transduction histidine kinase
LQLLENARAKLAIITGLTALTLAIHYGWVFEPIFGQAHWTHALHGRFCYIPIVVAASWFGIRGGLFAATAISVLVLPLIFGREQSAHDFVSELVEIVFYYFIAILSGALIDREFLARRRQQQAELSAERSQKLSMAGQIAAGVAHEIKNPLASIKGAVEILADDKTDPEAREEFKNIMLNEVRRIDTRVTDFLSFAQPREYEFKDIDLSEIIKACVKQVEPQAVQAGIDIKSQIANNINIYGDSGKLHQMTLNLLLNAIQASKEGDLIEIVSEQGDGSSATLVISDSGTGIEGDDLARIFEPFFTTRASGTGLGLAIVKSIVDCHNGNISIESNLGSGTAVTVKIPVGKTDQG